MAEQDAERQARHTEAATKRHIRREIQKAKLRQIKNEARQAKAELRIPDFSGMDMSTSDDQLASEVLVEQRATKCKEAFSNESLPNASIDAIADYLSCSKADARAVRNFLHKKGILVKHLNGHMKVAN